jgi:hypothetical protein
MRREEEVEAEAEPDVDPRRGKDGGRARLVETTRKGGITLVFGAGISLPCGIPSWGRLVERLWMNAFPKQPMPDSTGLPQFLPLALDLIARKLRRKGEDAFRKSLRSALYEDLELMDRPALESEDRTLAVLARLLVQEFTAGGQRRITRVITFNVDDLIEHAVGMLVPDRRVLKPVVRASQNPERGQGQQAIPIYHVHGSLPNDPDPSRAWLKEAGDALVFTDSQYWSSVSSPMSFANRVMSFALHDSRCIFIGCSMTDINLLRWLAMRANEIEADKASQFELSPEKGNEKKQRSARLALDRHFWIRPDADDPNGFLGQCLNLRGIRCVALESWRGPSFRALIEECFPPL